MGGLPLIHIEPPTWSDASRWGKRTFDLVGSSLLILAFAPLLAFTALQVKAHDRGPVFFRQIRTGKDGEAFSCLKFRTMCVDAEARLAALHAQTGYTGGLFKMQDDPRITRVGKIIRRFSIDELPQLFNVLKGEMSLIGPRPDYFDHAVEYLEKIPGYRERHAVRPGISGLAQTELGYIEGMDATRRKVKADLYYISHMSFALEMWIFWRTLSVVAKRGGA